MPPRTLPESLAHLCVSEHLADVTFTFSDGDHATVHAHRLILAMRSEVFEAMFYGPLTETESPIKIEDIDSDTFKKLLRYVYTDRVDLDKENTMLLLYAARKYFLDGLFGYCSEFLERSMTIENVCDIYEQAKFYDMKELVETCFTYIINNATDFMKTSFFTGLSHQTMCTVLSCEHLRTTEIENFNALLAWANAKKDVGDVSPAAARHVIGDALYRVRLPLVPSDVFTGVVVESGILTTEETLELYKHITTLRKGPEKDVGRFSSKIRMGAQYCVKILYPPADISRYLYSSDVVKCTVCIETSLKLGVRSILFPFAAKFVSVTCWSSDKKTVDITDSVFLDDDDKRLVFNPPLSLRPKHVSRNKIHIKLELDHLCSKQNTAFDCYGSTGVIKTNVKVMAVCLVK